MPKSSGTLQVDRDAREVFTLAAMAVQKNDGTAALDVCRKLIGIEEHYRLALRVGADAERKPLDENDLLRAGKLDPDPEAGTKPVVPPRRPEGATLRRITARFTSRCAKCARSIQVGTSIAYDAAAKRAFHDECA